MLAELSAWNDGKGIDLESWVSSSGNFRLAVGYSTVFWPRFMLFEKRLVERAGNRSGDRLCCRAMSHAKSK